MPDFCPGISTAHDAPRPSCAHGPMVKVGQQHGKQQWRCGEKRRERDRVANMKPEQIKRKRERARERGRRRIRIRAGGIQFSIGYAPTPEQAQYLRRKITQEAPHAVVRNA